MKSQLRIFWLVSLLFFLTGCSGFQPACFTGDESVSQNDMSRFDDCHLQTGERVRITTTDGVKVAGDIQRITADWIVLTPANSSEPPRLLTPSLILRIEKSKTARWKPTQQVNPEIGDKVGLTLVDGSNIEGVALAVSDTTIVLEHDSGPDQRLEVPREDIAYMELMSGGPSWVAPVAITLGVALVVGGIWLGNEMSHLDDGFDINWGGY